MNLFRSGNPIPTFFDLLGHYENDLTSGLAFALSRSPMLLRAMVKSVCGKTFDDNEKSVIQIQTARRCEGITDIEISLSDDFFCVIEAKNGPWLPTEAQLACYAPIAARKHAKHKCMVTISHATSSMSNVKFPTQNVKGLPLTHLSWRSVKQLVDDSVRSESNRNKWILSQFSTYLEALLGMENKFSNMVYVVSLGGGNPKDWNLSWIDIVEKRNRYFYPIGKSGWPDPPNYMGFRYDGRLQAIHWVKSHIVFTHPNELFPEAPVGLEWEPHYCLLLDAPIKIEREIRAGKRVHMSNRVWCAIDLLLTSKTLSDALTATEQRRQQPLETLTT